MKYFAIKFRAGNDTNGNPRRVFVVFDKNGKMIDAINEGYYGHDILYRKYPDAIYNYEFDLSPSTYKELLKMFK